MLYPSGSPMFVMAGSNHFNKQTIGHVDAKRLKQLLVKFARSFQVRDGEINMVNHGFPPFV